MEVLRKRCHGYGELLTGELAKTLRRTPFFTAFPWEERGLRRYADVADKNTSVYCGTTGPTKALALLLNRNSERLEEAVKRAWCTELGLGMGRLLPRSVRGNERAELEATRASRDGPQHPWIKNKTHRYPGSQRPRWKRECGFAKICN